MTHLSIPAKSAGNYIKETFTKNYFKFSGRARRSEYGYSILGAFTLSLITNVLDGMMGYVSTPDMPVGPISTLMMLAILIPILAVTVRRLHDAGRSGLWVLPYFIPLLGWLWLLYLLTTDSQKGSNKWGMSPKYPATTPESARPQSQPAI